MSLSKKIKISVTVGIVVAILFSICSFAKTSEEIRSDVLRLHVIANSDTSVDQNLKLRLRDYILQEGKDIFNGSVNVENAVEKIEPVLPELEKSAKAFVNQAGFDYDVKIKLFELLKKYYKTHNQFDGFSHYITRKGERIRLKYIKTITHETEYSKKEIIIIEAANLTTHPRFKLTHI